MRLHPNLSWLLLSFAACGSGSSNDAADTTGSVYVVIDTSTGQPVPVSYDTSTSSNAVNRDYAVPLYAALRGSDVKIDAGSQVDDMSIYQGAK